ncbi:MAG: HAD family hydrolase [Chloroflexota bacterium]
MLDSRNWLARLDAVVFDLDGTLVQLTIDFRQMRSEVYGLAERYGVVVDERRRQALALEFVAETTAELRRQSLQLAERFHTQAHAAIEAIELAAARQAGLFAGVPELLNWLHQRGLRLGVITRNCRLAAGAALASLEPLMGVILTRDDVPAVKPHPVHLGRALEVLGVSGGRTLVVGDHPLDVVTGKAAGAYTAGVLQPGETPERFAAVAPDLVLNGVIELRAHLSA